MSTCTWLHGPLQRVLPTIPDGSHDLIGCSPPFWLQREYLPKGHPLKLWEIGQEAHPADFIHVLLWLTAEWGRILTPFGSIAIELGDTMGGSGGSGGDYGPEGWRAGQPKFEGSATRKHARVDGAAGPPIPSRRDLDGPGRKSKTPGILDKSHCGIPEAYRLSLIYGINVLNGEPSPAGQWIVRNTIDWCRRNPTPGDDGDKFRRATSDIVIATKAPDRWWDPLAVRVPSEGAHARTAKGVDVRENTTPKADQGGNTNRDTLAIQHLPGATRPMYDWWDLSSDPYPGAHYAVWPSEVAKRLIEAMCPFHVCTTCGEPQRRVLRRASDQSWEHDHWTDCGHDTWRVGNVLDPFGGSGTTGAVATGLGRDATLVDLDDRNYALALDRIGMFLQEGPSAVVG